MQESSATGYFHDEYGERVYLCIVNHAMEFVHVRIGIMIQFWAGDSQNLTFQEMFVKIPGSEGRTVGGLVVRLLFGNIRLVGLIGVTVQAIAGVLSY